MKFLDVKTDYAFKKVFGSKESVPVLISFLNAILDYDEENKITNLDIVDPYQIPLLKGMKDTFVDVKAQLANGKQYASDGDVDYVGNKIDIATGTLPVRAVFANKEGKLVSGLFAKILIPKPEFDIVIVPF